MVCNFYLLLLLISLPVDCKIPESDVLVALLLSALSMGALIPYVERMNEVWSWNGTRKGFFFFLNLFFIYLFLAVLGLRFCARAFSLVVASGGHSSSRCAGLSLSRPLLLRSTGSRGAGSVIVAHGPSCFAACGIFPDQGTNPCPLH